jgi:hypothetical protein
MSKKKKKKKSNRIEWDDPSNFICVHLINHGFHGAAIARVTGLSVPQVYYRAKRMGLRLRGYRDGTGPVAYAILRRFTVRRGRTNVEQAQVRRNLLPDIEKRLG